jgi:hypothetical protein
VESAKSTSRWARNHPNRRRADAYIDHGSSQHPFGNQAAICVTELALGHRTRPFGFASQPYDWFAFSRMMTLQALMSRN